MHVVKIRRVGNSNVVTLPHQFEESGYAPGTSVVVEQTATGELLIVPESRLRGRIQELGRRVVAEHREALDLLEAFDHGEAAVADGELRRAPAADS